MSNYVPPVVRNLNKGNVFRRLLGIGIMAVAACLLIIYATTELTAQSGNFSIKTSSRVTQGGAVLSLSETNDFENPSAYLACLTPYEMGDLSGKKFDDDFEDTLDGSHNGLWHIGYTFYVKNTGDTVCALAEQMEILSDVKVNGNSAVDAMRIRIYRDGVRTDYAAPAKDGSKEEAFCDEMFDGNNVFKNIAGNLKPGDTVKYTIVIWLEGSDPECLDNIRGGNVKLSMNLSVDSFED